MTEGRPAPGLLARLSQEGFRLFFPISAVYAGSFPILWLVAGGLDLPLARDVPAGLWHGYEMIIGAFGAALIGFLTTAVPEWTDSKPPKDRTLWAFCAVWMIGRVSGLLGWQGVGLVGAMADLLWIAALAFWLVRLSVRRRTDRLIAFAFWLVVLAACAVGGRLSFAFGDLDLAARGIHLAGFAFLGLLGLSLARITVPVTNLILDPTEKSSPYRPHPGRRHLATGLIFVAILGDAFFLSPAVSGFLILAAGAAFMDRVAEAFVGRLAARAEILMLAGSAMLAGVGLLLIGTARLGAPWGQVTGMHVALMGGLGLGIYAVFSIAGLLHTDRPLGLSRRTRLGALLVVFAVGSRIAPDLGFPLPGPVYGAASLIWALAFFVWLTEYWPYLIEGHKDHTCGRPGSGSNPVQAQAAE
ncbi:MAG: NnrS family protein [Pseudomonadota bacterium]